MNRLGALAGALFLSATMAAAPAYAQETAEQAAPAAAAGTATPVPEGMVRLAMMTPVAFEFVDDIKSNTAKIDAMFAIRLSAPIVVNGVAVVPAGTMGQGQVVHAAKAGWGGKAGELIVAVRFLDFNGVRIPLRRFRMGGIGMGRDRVGTAFAVGAVAPLASFFVNGGEKEIHAGTHANAIIAADTDIPAPASPAAGPPASETPAAAPAPTTSN